MCRRKKKRVDKAKILRWLQFAIMLALILTAVYYRKQITVDAILSNVPESYVCAFFVFMLLYLLKSATVVVPLLVLYVASGMVFGGWVAIPVNICGVAMCTSLPYFTGRLTGTELYAAAETKIPESVSHFLEEHNVSYFHKSLLLRVIGIVPSDIIGYYFGASHTPFAPYFLGSVIGFLPDLIPQTLIGVGASDPHSPLFIVSAIVSMVLKITTYILSRAFTRKTR